MPDKEREEFFINLFLEDYNTRAGKHYAVVGRPEEEAELTGTYDFLCEDSNSAGDYLAVEEKSLRKSTENVRENVEIAETVAEVNRVLSEKGLFWNKEYLFHLEFRNVPATRERTKYAEKIARVVEEAINKNKDADARQRVLLDVDGCDSIKKFYLLGTHKRPKVTFGFAPESNVSWDVQADTFQAVCQILENSNRKLKAPKQEGKKTILLISNYFIIVDEQNVREATECMEEQCHQNIDEIFFVNKRSFEPGYAINRVK